MCAITGYYEEWASEGRGVCMSAAPFCTIRTANLPKITEKQLGREYSRVPQHSISDTRVTVC